MNKEQLEDDKAYIRLFNQNTKLSKRVKELDSFKSSVEYTVDSETLELIINNQDSENVLKMSETYDEEIFLLLQQNQRYREIMEKSKKAIQANLQRWNYKDEEKLYEAYKELEKALEGEE